MSTADWRRGRVRNAERKARRLRRPSGTQGLRHSGTQALGFRDIRYIDAPLLRDRDTDANGSLDETLHYCNDANMNVTALVNTSGTVVERYQYDPYGKPSFFDGSWTPRDESAFANEILYCGYRHDPETGLYQVRHRYYHPTLGRWLSRDPAEYDSGFLLYEYVSGGPVNWLDALGLWRLEGDVAVATRGDTLWRLARILGTQVERLGYTGDPRRMPVGTRISVSEWTAPRRARVQAYLDELAGLGNYMLGIKLYCSAEEAEKIVQEALRDLSTHLPAVLQEVGLDRVPARYGVSISTGQYVSTGNAFITAGLTVMSGSTVGQRVLTPLGNWVFLKGPGTALTLAGVGLEGVEFIEAGRADDPGRAISSASGMGLGIASIFYPPAAIAGALGAFGKMTIELVTASHEENARDRRRSDLCETHRRCLEQTKHKMKMLSALVPDDLKVLNQFEEWQVPE